jgi:hypothetical protein
MTTSEKQPQAYTNTRYLSATTTWLQRLLFWVFRVVHVALLLNKCLYFVLLFIEE